MIALMFVTTLHLICPNAHAQLVVSSQTISVRTSDDRFVVGNLSTQAGTLVVTTSGTMHVGTTVNGGGTDRLIISSGNWGGIPRGLGHLLLPLHRHRAPLRSLHAGGSLGPDGPLA